MEDYWKRFWTKYLDKELFLFLFIAFLVIYGIFSNNKKEVRQEQRIVNKI